MTADQLAAVVDPVAWLLAIGGALGFVATAIALAIEGARHHGDRRAWATERRALRREARADRQDVHSAGYVAGWRDAVWTMSTPVAVDSDEQALAAHHTAAACEGLTAPPPDGQPDTRWN